QKHQVNTMWLTSTLYNQMIVTDAQMFNSLKYLLIGGEKLSEEQVRILKSQEGTVRLINGYGPTENTTFTTTYEIPNDFDFIPIGKP
ncbi:TPA: AMP-binding protein, partial [Bacillus mobilis]|nr:AMP-binding protein [Bacillus mobilis]